MHAKTTSYGAGRSPISSPFHKKFSWATNRSMSRRTIRLQRSLIEAAEKVCALRSSGSGASALNRNDRNLVSAIDKPKRAPDPIAPSATARDAVGRRQMRIAFYECGAYALGAAGGSGVRDMLDILREELRVAMILTGCSDVNRAGPDLLLKDCHTPQHRSPCFAPQARTLRHCRPAQAL